MPGGIVSESSTSTIREAMNGAHLGNVPPLYRRKPVRAGEDVRTVGAGVEEIDASGNEELPRIQSGRAKTGKVRRRSWGMGPTGTYTERSVFMYTRARSVSIGSW